MIKIVSALALLIALTTGASAAFYVSSSGNDGNVGSRASPFLTASKCDAAMVASPTVKTCYFLTSMTLASWPIHGSETWSGDPAQAARSIALTLAVANVGCAGCSNVVITDLIISSGSLGGNSNMFNFSATSGVHIELDTVNITSAVQAISAFNNDSFYVRGNTFNGSTTNALDVISVPINDHVSHSSIYITDNVFDGCDRMCLEMQNQTDVIVTNFHVDRNWFFNFEGAHNTCAPGAPTYMAASIVYGNAAGNNGNTFWGNVMTTPMNANTCIIGLEMTTGGTSIEENTFNGQSYMVEIAGASGTEFENNTFNMPITNTVATSPHIQSWSQDGGFVNPVAFWIGTNTIVGVSTNSVTGCLSGAGNPPGYCGLSSGNVFPPKPPVYSPSPAFP